MLLEPLEKSDVRDSARRSASEREPERGPLGGSRGKRGKKRDDDEKFAPSVWVVSVGLFHTAASCTADDPDAIGDDGRSSTHRTSTPRVL